ncbi:MAG: T9SS type A sorting domain-containing protein [Bacteroidota bacterium]
MKKILLLTSVLISAIGFSQIALKKHNGTPINSGEVIAFNTVTFPTAELDFYVVNTSTTASTNVRINCTSLVNNDGIGFELCFANECLASVEEGSNYPINLPYLTLAPGAQSGNDGHFLNTPLASVSAPFPKDYAFRFFQAGNPSGNFVDVTYRYDPSLSIDDINQLQTSGVIVKSTMVQNELVFDVLKSTSMTIYDLNGKTVYATSLNYGIQTIDVSNLNSGMYVINFTNAEGNSSAKKFIKN